MSVLTLTVAVGAGNRHRGCLFQASRDHPGLRLERTVMIGDSETDVEAATAAGACAIRLGPEGTKSAAEPGLPRSFVSRGGPCWFDGRTTGGWRRC